MLGYQGANLSISATSARGGAPSGLLWVTYPDVNPNVYGTGHLEVYDALSLSSRPLVSLPLHNGSHFQKFTPPVVAHGSVYVATADAAVLVYGLPQ